MFKALRVGFLISFVGPLVFVLAVTMIKEAYDDMKRYNKDCEQNARLFEKIDLEKGVIKEVAASSLAVGDLVKIHVNQAAPADLILVHVTDKSDSVFIRTDQLDGETDWKARRPLHSTHKNVKQLTDLQQYIKDNVLCERPSQAIYEFTGLYTHITAQGEEKEALGLENTMWANTVLASQGYVIGLVTYTGRDTRAQMNAKLPQSKMCLLEEEVNFLSKMLFVFLVLLSGLITMLNGFHGHYEIFYFRIMILLCSIIPISVRINLDLAKLFYCFQINTDEHIPGVIARNSNIPEELGRIQFLLSDKTGTLTQNVMTCMRIHTEYAQYTITDNKREMLQMIEYSCQQSPHGPAQDYHLDAKTNQFVARRREQSVVIRDMLTALALCNNVTPVIEQDDKPIHATVALDKVHDDFKDEKAARKSIMEGHKEPQLEASSPDEVAMVKFGF
jgi:phospholipid-translocating ATPase